MTQQAPPPPSPEIPYGQQPPAYGAPAPARGTNMMAILALVFAFVFSPLGIVFGIIGRKQIARTGEGGKGLATAGMVLGIVFVLGGIVLAVVIGVAAATVAGSVPPAPASAPAAPAAPASPSTASISVTPDALQEQIATQSQGRATDITCPEPLPGQVGASVTCTATVDGQEGQVRTTVTSVDGNNVAFDIASVG